MSKMKGDIARAFKALPLVAFSAVEMSVSFIRMLILTHILGPYEFGFAAALSATYATIEQISDLAIFRFVTSSPRSVQAETIAVAHALTIIRGLSLSVIILIISHPLSCVLARCDDWVSFALLSSVAMIRSFENLDVRVGERDYRYGAQLRAAIASHGVALIALTVCAYESRSHYAFVVYLVAQSVIYTLATHVLALRPYRVTWKSRHLPKALNFGLPLMFNGIGLAILSQGDRLMVGSILGLTTLGYYAVLFLASTVPISGLLRILNPLFFAGIHNASGDKEKFEARVKLYIRTSSILACFYAAGILTFFKPLLPLVFGARFEVSDLTASLIALIASTRILRAEPATSLLLNAQKSLRLTFVNLSPFIGLFVATVLAVTYKSIDAVLIGILVGEICGLIFMALAVRDLIRHAAVDQAVFNLLVFFILLTAAILIAEFDTSIVSRFLILGGVVMLTLFVAAISLPGPYRAAYRDGSSLR